MKIKQNADCEISIVDKESGNNLVFVMGTEIEVCQETGSELLNMKSFDFDGNIATDFVEV